MHGLRRWLGAALVLGVGGVIQLSTALADERTDARREFRAGMQAVAEGRYDEGVAHLEAAYDTLPHPNVLYNIGLAHMYAGRSDEAISYFERYKETAPPSDAAEVDALIANLRGKSEAQQATVTQAPVAEGGERDDDAARIEVAAREVRRMADETNNDALKRQADDLDAMAKSMRAGQPGGSGDVTSAPRSPPPKTTRPAPPREKERGARQGVYEEEVISASRFAQSPLDAPNATAIITAQDIRMTGLTNLTDLLRRVAGMEITSVAPAQAEISIRGLNRRTSNKVLFLIDGRSHRFDFNGSAWLNQPPIALEDVERVEIIRGPASALYGADAFSGIVNIITRAPGEGKPYVLGSYGSKNTARGVASFMGRSGKLSYKYSTQYLQTDNAVVPAGPNRVDIEPYADRPNVSRRAASANGELRYDAARDTQVSVGGQVLYNDTTTIQGLSRLAEITSPGAWESHVYATLLAPKGFRIATWWMENNGDPGPSSIVPNAINTLGTGLKNDVVDADVSWSGRFKLLVPQNLTVGGGYRFKSITWEFINGVRRQHHFAAYIQDVLQLAKPLTLQIGARLDHHPLLNSQQFSPRGSLVYRFLEQQSLRASIGRAFRGPSMLESYLQSVNAAPQRGISALGVGNEQLDPENMVSYEIGYQNQASDYFSLEANAYLNMVKDAILFADIRQYTLQEHAAPGNKAEYDPEVQAFPYSTLKFANERGTFRQLGGELGVRVFPVPGLDLYGNYAFHDTSPLSTNNIDPVRAKEQQTSMHKVNAGIQYRAPFGLSVSADFSWNSGQVWVEQVSDAARGVAFGSFDVDQFFWLSGRLGYRLWDDQLDLGVVGTNLTFQKQRQHPFSQPVDTRVLGTARLRF